MDEARASQFVAPVGLARDTAMAAMQRREGHRNEFLSVTAFEADETARRSSSARSAAMHNDPSLVPALPTPVSLASSGYPQLRWGF